MALPGRLKIDLSTGKLIGPAKIKYNDPFPTLNGTPGSGSSSMMGVVMHTEQGTESGTIQTFNNPSGQASAFFGIGNDGVIWQFGPVGVNWMAWAQAAGNPEWYSIEHEGWISQHLTPEQIIADAQVVECLSAFADFPLQVSDSVSVKGYGWHGMGGVSWGNHTNCPGDLRKAQRPEILALARQIRGGVPVVKAETARLVRKDLSTQLVTSHDGKSWA